MVVEGTGPAVVVIPGRGDSSDVYPAEFTDALVAAGCSVLRVDSRDTGLSADGGDVYRLSTMADDFVAIATIAGLDRLHVVGLSMGGMVTVDLALRHRDRVASLVFLSAMSPDPEAGIGPRFFDGIGADPVAGTLASMGAASDEDERWMRDRVASSQARAAARPAAALRHQQAALRLGWPTVDDLASIDAPTLVVHGAVDLVLPVAHARGLAGHIPNARLHDVDGMGHLPTRREWIMLAHLVAAHVAAASHVSH